MPITQAYIDSILGKTPPLQRANQTNQPTITNTPRGIISGTYADILKPFASNPIGEFLGASDIQRALESASYGSPVTTGGSVQTGGLRPEYLAAALGLTPAGKGKNANTAMDLMTKYNDVIKASGRTQIAGTLPTYQKSLLYFNKADEPLLDYGAGLGEGAKAINASATFEPNPKTGFNPTFTNSEDIPSDSYGRITNFNVLNVVPREVRDYIVKDIGRVLKPNGEAIITTRGKDVLNAKGVAGSEPMSLTTSIGTYQKGFTQKELSDYIQAILGQDFKIDPVRKLGAAGVKVTKIRNNQ